MLTSKSYALICPGQGQLLKAPLLYHMSKYPDIVQPLLDTVLSVMGPDFSTFLTSTECEEWSRDTTNVQPATLASTYVAYRVAAQSENIARNARFILGHSLGEFSALLLAGAWDFRTALEIVKYRAELMSRVTHKYTSAHGMYALLTRDGAGLLAAARARKLLANDNSAEQVVVSGEMDQLREFIRGEKRVRRAIQLPVAMAFHHQHPLLRQAETDLLQLVSNTPISKEFQWEKIILNVNGRVPRSAHEAVANACLGISQPVLWRQSIDYCAGKEVDTLVHLGPGNALFSVHKRDARFAQICM